MTEPFTPKQRKALHVWCRLMATTLNDAGLETKTLLQGKLEKKLTKLVEKWRTSGNNYECEGVQLDLARQLEAVIERELVQVDIPWSMETVKELIWKPVLKAMTGEDSTEDMTTIDPTAVLEVIIRHMAGYGVVIPPWPSLDEQSRSIQT